MDFLGAPYNFSEQRFQKFESTFLGNEFPGMDFPSTPRSFVGWSNDHFDNLQFKVSLETHTSCMVQTHEAFGCTFASGLFEA